MRDEMDARMWLAHGAAFSKTIMDFLGRAKPALDRIHAYHFAAPWRREGRGPA
jgi:hypothetical protein